jgi:hypothetical protein
MTVMLLVLYLFRAHVYRIDIFHGYVDKITFLKHNVVAQVCY